MKSLRTYITSGFMFTINWPLVLSFVSFWVYGLFGFLTIQSWGLLGNSLASLLLLGIFLCLFSLRKKEAYTTNVVITGTDIKVLLGYLLCMFVITYSDLFLPIDGDQLYHSQQAVLHSIIAIQILGNYIQSIGTFSFANLIWVFNIIMTLGGVALYFLLRNKKEIYIIGTLVTLFLVSRLTVLLMLGNSSAFPPFRLFPVWLSELVFSPSNFGFRVATFIGLILCMWFVERNIREKTNLFVSVMCGLAIGTIPVLWHVGTLVEPSLWAGICFVFVLFCINNWSNGKKLNYFVIISAIVLFSTMRVSSFITLIPIGIMMLIDYTNRILTKKEFLYSLVPTLILLPILFASFYLGTPSTYTGDISLDPYIPANASLFERLAVLFTSGGIMTYVYNSLRFPLVLFLLIIPCYFFGNIKRGALITLLFVVGCVLFYSINPVFWGHGRYQAEYLAPFIIFGIYISTYWLYRRSKNLAVVFLTILIICNIYLYKHIGEMNSAMRGQDTYGIAIKKLGDYFVVSEFPYSFTYALQQAKNNGYAGKIYYATGNGYGYFSQILSGYSVDEMRQEKEIYTRIGGDITAEKIDKETNIQLVLVNGSENNHKALPQKIADDLQTLGWVQWKEFSNDRFGTSIFGLQRK